MHPVTYKKAGVDIDEADDFIRRIKPLVKSTTRAEVLGGIGGFGGLFQPRLQGMKDPVLVSSTDGVGTKLMLADLRRKYDTVGIDLVAMSVDDVVVTGAEPLFFLDYIACGKVRKRHAGRGDQGHRQRLPGGELRPPRRRDGRASRALREGPVGPGRILRRDRGPRPDHRRPDVPAGGHGHRAGFERPPQQRLFPGPQGLHSDGAQGEDRGRAPAADPDLHESHPRGDETRPHQGHGPHHRRRFLRQHPPGRPGRPGRARQEGLLADSPIFRLIQERGRITDREMHRTLNMGIGMAVVVGPKDAGRSAALFTSFGAKAYVIGEVARGPHEVTIS